MSVSLTVTIFVIGLILFVYLFFVIRRYVNQRSQTAPFARLMKANMAQEKVISESPIYHETKDEMAHLRSSLDEFRERVDIISKCTQANPAEDLDTAYEVGIPNMHNALTESRKTALSLLKVIDVKTERESSSEVVHGSKHCAPSSLPSDDVLDLSDINHLWTELIYAVDGVSPCIAGFYYALSSPDRRTQKELASQHIDMVIDCLDEALKVIVELEKKLAVDGTPDDLKTLV